MFGMDTMSTAVEPLAHMPEFQRILLMFSNPVLGMLVGVVLTAVIQSSSASIGILQALCVTGAVSYATALPIIMGQNVGTCVTALISSAGAGKNAKRAALIHLYFNIIKTVSFMLIFYTVNLFVRFAFLNTAASALGVAVIHTALNVAAVMVVFPFTSGLIRLAYLTIPETGEEESADKTDRKELHLLDTRFLSAPGFALEQCRNVSVDMANLAKEALFTAIHTL